MFFQIALVTLPLALHVNAASCDAWTKKKADTVKCTGAVGTLTCHSKCCEADTTKCGGKTDSCGTDKHKATAKKGNTIGTDFAGNCCDADKKCSAIACATGYEKDDTKKDNKCQSDDVGCGTTICCKLKASTCLHYTGSTACPAATHVTLASKATSDGNTPATCCQEKIKCKDVTCSTGKGMKDATNKGSTTYCSSSFESENTAAKCADNAAGCCVVDDTKCRAFTGCGTDHYLTNFGTAHGGGTDAQKKTKCCVAVATCKDYWAFSTTTASTSGAVQGMPAVAAVLAIIAVTASLM